MLNIATQLDSQTGQVAPGLSLLFAEGMRPDADAVVRFAEGSVVDGVGFSVTHRPDHDASWLELLASGMTFDLSGLAPEASASIPPRGHGFGLEPEIATERLEAISLAPGPHLSGGVALLPVIRAMMGLAAQLACLPGVRAVCWHPARSWMEPGYFTRVIAAWLGGGAFPALGLTALSRAPGGGLASEGLAFLIGQELQVDPLPDEPPAESAKLAVRLIHHLVGNGPIDHPQKLSGPEGSRLQAEPSADGRSLRVWRAK